MGLIERGRRAYTAWSTTYPSTHERAGQTVEVVTRDVYEALARQHAGAVGDAERGRALVDRMFELPRGPEWEQALAELRVWSMKDHNPGGQ